MAGGGGFFGSTLMRRLDRGCQADETLQIQGQVIRRKQTYIGHKKI